MTSATVIDPHVHVWLPEYIPPALRMSWAQGAATRRAGRSADDIYPRVSQDIRDPDGAHLLSAMESAGVAQAVIMGVDYGPETWAKTSVPVAQIMRRYDEICCASDGRLFYAVGIDPRRPDAVATAREHLARDTCRGIKFYPPAGFRASDESCHALYEVLEDTDKAAVFHTAAVRGRLLWRNAWPVYLADVQARHPALRIVLAHAGAPCWWDECLALAANHGRTYLELSLWDRDARSGDYDFAAMLRRAVRMCGSDRILFASDTMYGEQMRGVDDWKAWIDYFRQLPETSGGALSENDVENMLSRNATEVFFGGS
jgi:predicted TIM-barrel fold metal-dependent hydrolase